MSLNILRYLFGQFKPNEFPISTSDLSIDTYLVSSFLPIIDCTIRYFCLSHLNTFTVVMNIFLRHTSSAKGHYGILSFISICHLVLCNFNPKALLYGTNNARTCNVCFFFSFCFCSVSRIFCG